MEGDAYSAFVPCEACGSLCEVVLDTNGNGQLVETVKPCKRCLDAKAAQWMRKPVALRKSRGR